jgi:hypothetical protein
MGRTRNAVDARRPVSFEAYHRNMTDHARSLLREALSLSEEERADLAAELLLSLEDPAPDDVTVVEQAWADEVTARARQTLAGEERAEDWEQVRSRVSRILTDG